MIILWYFMTFFVCLFVFVSASDICRELAQSQFNYRTQMRVNVYGTCLVCLIWYDWNSIYLTFLCVHLCTGFMSHECRKNGAMIWNFLSANPRLTITHTHFSVSAHTDTGRNVSYIKHTKHEVTQNLISCL